jgi:WD40 repeat protein
LERERRNAYNQRIALAEREWAANNLRRMQQLLDECPEDLRGWEWHYLNRLRYKTLPPLHHDGAVHCAAFSPDGRRIASSDADGWVKVWDAQTGDELLKFRAYEDDHARSVAFSPDGQRLATASWDGTVKTWDAQTGRELPASKRHAGQVQSTAFNADDRYWVDSQDQTVKVWDAQTGQQLLLRGHTAPVQGVAFSPDGRRLASASADQTVKLWDLQTGQEVLTLRGHSGTVRKVAFSPDGRRLVSASGDRTVRVWDATPSEGEPDHGCLTLRGHTSAINTVAFHPKDPRVLASASADGTVRLWDAKSGKQLHSLLHADRVAGLAFSPDGQRLASTQPKRVRLWDVATSREIIPPLPLATISVAPSVAFSPNGRLLAAGEYAHEPLIIWDVATGEPIHKLPNTWVVWGVAFDPDSKWIASANNDGTVRVRDVATGEEVVRTPLRHGAGARTVAFSADGRWLASGSADQTVKVWDTTTWKPRLVLRDPTGRVWSVAFSPDSKCLAWGSSDGTVKVWDEVSEEVHTLRGHTGWVNSVAFSADGKQIASGSEDGTVKVWEAPPLPEQPRPAAGKPDE